MFLFKKTLIIFTILSIILSSVELKSNTTGKEIFERAYSIEKENPDLAIEYYNKALEMGLKSDLKKTSLWRLYFLYKDKKLFIKAWEILNQIQHKQNIREKFFEDVVYYTKINQEEFITLYNHFKNERISEMLAIYKKASPILKKEILEYYESKEKEDILLNLIQTENNDSTDAKIFLASYYIEKQSYNKAEKVLMELSMNNANEMPSSYKEKILYLYSKLKKDTNPLQSVFFNLLALEYTTISVDYEKELALAMFGLYKNGYEQVSYNLLDFIYYTPNEPMQRLFILLLMAEKNPDNRNLTELRKLARQLDQNSFLVTRANKLLNQYNYDN